MKEYSSHYTYNKYSSFHVPIPIYLRVVIDIGLHIVDSFKFRFVPTEECLGAKFDELCPDDSARTYCWILRYGDIWIHQRSHMAYKSWTMGRADLWAITRARSYINLYDLLRLIVTRPSSEVAARVADVKLARKEYRAMIKKKNLEDTQSRHNGYGWSGEWPEEKASDEGHHY